MEAELTDALVGLIEYKDAATATHTWRVVFYAMAVAEELGTDPERTRRIARAAALHDVGKIDIPGAILRKPSALTPEEYEIVQQHPALGYDRLIALGETDQLVLDVVRHHHERWDGRGYPDGLVGEQIPCFVRYFSIIDTFDALTGLRSYRGQTDAEAAKTAIAIIEDDAGQAYAPEAVELFVRLFDSGKLDWIRAYSNDETAFSIAAANDELGMRGRTPEA